MAYKYLQQYEPPKRPHKPLPIRIIHQWATLALLPLFTVSATLLGIVWHNLTDTIADLVIKQERAVSMIADIRDTVVTSKSVLGEHERRITNLELATRGLGERFYEPPPDNDLRKHR